MKSDKSPSVPEYLLNFDVTKYPLLNEVWEILEEINNCKDREAIYRKYPGMTATKKYFNINIKPVCVAETDLEILLDTMYEIDKQKEYATGLLGTFDAIKRMPGGKHVYWDDVEHATETEYENYGKNKYKYRKIRKLKAEFFDYIGRIQKLRKEKPLPLIGDFEIINGSDTRMSFGDFYSFREELLGRIRQELILGKIPLFQYYHNFKQDCESDIYTLANSITRFLEKDNFPVEDFSLLLWKLYEQGFNIQFSRNFEQQYITGIMRQLTFTRRPDKLRMKAKAAAIKRKKELLNKDKSHKAANAIVQEEFENMPEYKELFKLKNGDPWGTTNWKVFLQDSKNGKDR